MEKQSNRLFIYGKNPVREALAASRATEVFVLGRLSKDPLIEEARKAGVKVTLVDENRLASLAKTSAHQGFGAWMEPPSYLSLEDFLKVTKGKKNPLLVLLDGIEDPHNLGAILRSCDAFGVDAVVIKNRGEVQLNSTVAKVSTGAVNWVPVITVTNLTRAIEKLKENGYWIVASDGSATSSYTEVDYRGPMAVIVGSEGFGISKLVLKNADFVTKIPMCGHVNSLNASVATAVYLAFIHHQRNS